MEKNYLGLLFIIVSMSCLGISTFIYKKSTEAVGPVNTTFFYYLFAFIMAGIYWLIFREEQPFSKTDLIWPLLVALFLFISVLTFNYALSQLLPISIASAIRSLSFVVTIALAVIITREKIHPKDIVAIVLATAALTLFFWKPD